MEAYRSAPFVAIESAHVRSASATSTEEEDDEEDARAIVETSRTGGAATDRPGATDVDDARAVMEEGDATEGGGGGDVTV